MTSNGLSTLASSLLSCQDKVPPTFLPLGSLQKSQTLDNSQISAYILHRTIKGGEGQASPTAFKGDIAPLSGSLPPSCLSFISPFSFSSWMSQSYNYIYISDISIKHKGSKKDDTLNGRIYDGLKHLLLSIYFLWLIHVIEE